MTRSQPNPTQPNRNESNMSKHYRVDLNKSPAWDVLFGPTYWWAMWRLSLLLADQDENLRAGALPCPRLAGEIEDAEAELRWAISI